MAQKTIVIGMGTTGREVVRRLVHRIEADYGDLSRLPWLRMLVFETEQIGGDLLERRGIARHFGVNADTWQRMKRNPNDYDDSILLPKWADEAVLGATNAPIQGAGGIRLAGRLCFFEDNNFTAFLDAFKDVYHDLDALTAAGALNAIQAVRPGAEVTFNTVGTGENRRDLIRAYVVGTLTGGTASGSFIDIGYMLNSLPGISQHLETTGIFAIPNSSYAGAIQWDNAMAALTELNHFHSDGTTYTSRFPSRGTFPHDITLRAQTPFTTACVVQPRSGDGKGNAIAQLQDSIAEIIFQTAMTDGSSPVDARLVDAFSNFEGEKDRKGRPMSFATLGASVIIFPVEHILSGCTARLGSLAFEELIGQQRPDDYEVAGFIRDNLGIEEERYQNLILKHPLIEKRLEELGQRTAQAAKAAVRGDASALTDLRLKVVGNKAFADAAYTQNYQGEFRSAIKDVAGEIAAQLKQRFDRLVVEMAADPQRGIVWTRGLVEGVIAYAVARLEKLERQNTEVDTYASAQASLDALEAAERKFAEKPGCLGMFKRNAAQQAASRNYEQRASSAWQASIRVNSLPFEKEILEEIKRAAEIYAERIRNADTGMLQFVRTVVQELRDEYLHRKANAPDVNGLALFEENKTIDEEYERFIPKEARHVYAAYASEIRGHLAKWFEDLVLPRDKSPYDRKREPTAEELEQIQKSARHPFEALLQETVENRLVAWPNWQQELKKIASLGRSFVTPNPAVNPYGVPQQPDSQRRAGAVYYHAADSTDVGSNAGLVARELKALPFKASDTGDHHRILFYDGLAIFSLASIPGVDARCDTPIEARRHTRKDIAWKRLNGKPLDPQQEYHAGLILVAAALGIVRYRVNAPMSYLAPKTAMHSEREFSLDQELTNASYHLSRDDHVSKSLDSKVKSQISDMTVEQAAQAIETFNDSVENRHLTFNGKQISKQEAFNRVLPFVTHIPRLLSELIRAGGGLPQLKLEDFLLPNVKGELAYRCPRCGLFFHGQGERISLTDLPIVCTNESCQYRVRYDDIIQDVVEEQRV